MIKRTNDQNHNNYILQVKSVFAITIIKSKKKYGSFRDLTNHKLWLESKITNFSNNLLEGINKITSVYLIGLRIIPLEISRIKDSSRKGLHFSNIVSKSANYYHPTKENPYRLFIFCDVALGKNTIF